MSRKRRTKLMILVRVTKMSRVAAGHRGVREGWEGGAEVAHAAAPRRGEGEARSDHPPTRPPPRRLGMRAQLRAARG